MFFSLLECGALLVLLRWRPAVYDPHADFGEAACLNGFPGKKMNRRDQLNKFCKLGNPIKGKGQRFL